MDPITIGAIIVSVAATGLTTVLSKFVRKIKSKHPGKVQVKLSDGKKLTLELPIDSSDNSFKEAIEEKLKIETSSGRKHNP